MKQQPRGGHRRSKSSGYPLFVDEIVPKNNNDAPIKQSDLPTITVNNQNFSTVRLQEELGISTEVCFFK